MKWTLRLRNAPLLFVSLLMGCQVSASSGDSGQAPGSSFTPTTPDIEAPEPSVDDDIPPSVTLDNDECALADFCESAPALSYENFGRAFMDQNCQTCHRSDATNRFGAPDNIRFDSESDIVALSASILDVAIRSRRMPPGGLTNDEATRFEQWLRCYVNEPPEPVASCDEEPTVDPDNTPPAQVRSTLTYNNFGKGFVQENCQGCHASTTPERFEAPSDVYFDTEADIKRQASLIKALVTGPNPSMPPSGGITEENRQLFAEWLTCLQNDNCGGELDSEFNFTDNPAPTPLALAEIEAGITAAMTASMDFDPSLLFDNYDDLLAKSDFFCPGGTLDSIIGSWNANCTTLDGNNAFNGRIAHFHYPPGTFSQGGVSFSQHAGLSGSGQIDYGDYSFSMVGNHSYDQSLVATSPDLEQTIFIFNGSAQWNDPAYAGTWLERGRSGAFVIGTILHIPSGYKAITLKGTIGRLGGTFDTIYAEENTIINAKCATEPSASMHFRDAEGIWYDVDFDGVAAVETPVTAACDGCGRVSVEGAALGEVCPDFSSLTAWGTRPW